VAYGPIQYTIFFLNFIKISIIYVFLLRIPLVRFRNTNIQKIKNADYDSVFDTVGRETYKRSFKVLKKGSGIIISMLEQPN
jgi:hypothetical protein